MCADTSGLNTALDTVIEFFLKSADFNGMPASQLAARDVRATAIALVRAGKVDAVFTNNSHVKHFRAEPIDEQVRKLEATEHVRFVCLYPSVTILETVVDRSRYEGRPFTLRLALGDGQLEFRAFDLMVLEHYRNDPRYHYQSDDVHGSIGVTDEYYRSDRMRDVDKVLLQTFGFCYDADLNRAVAVFMRYLSDLSPEHQQVWATRMLTGDYKLHPGYFDASILAKRPQGVPIFKAFLHEQHHINEIAKLIGRAPFFRETFVDSKPRGFGFLIRPTLREFNEFVQTLDKLMSDNISVDFFGGEVEREFLETRGDGVVVAKPKRTISILDEWTRRIYRPGAQPQIDEMLSTFRKVRKLRQTPAHAIRDDEFDQKYFKDQRELIMAAYDAVRAIRLMLAEDPAASGYSVPKWLENGTIWSQ
jgi:hypothetical protein